MKEEIRNMLRRAEGFLRDARVDFEKGDYDLAMFHIEQACQLLIKAKLLDLVGYFEKTHSLRRLLRDLSKIYREELEEFIDKNWKILRDLEFSYIASRYLSEEFRKEDVERAFKLYEKLKVLLWSS